MWEAYWRLRRDPFLGPRPHYVRTETHEEAVARVVFAVTNAYPLVVVKGPTGSGKSTVLNRAVSRARAPSRRILRVASPSEIDCVLEKLSTTFGSNRRRGRVASPWRTVAESLELATLQRLQPVIVIDDGEALWEGRGGEELGRLLRIATGRNQAMTVVLGLRPRPDSGDAPLRVARSASATLQRLTFSETVRFIEEKLEAGGRLERAFDPEALETIHELTGGVPAAIDRLAAHALMAGSLGHLDGIDKQVITDVAREFLGDWQESAA